jgi:MFS family permease
MSVESTAHAESGTQVSSWILRLYPALGVPAFRLLWGGMLPSQGANAMYQIGSGYAAFALTGSATTLGVVSFSAGIPGLLLTLVGGVVADRLPRHRVMLTVQAVMLVTSAAMVALVASGALAIWHLIVAALVQFAAFGFDGPARQALIGEVVGRSIMRNAIALTMAGMAVSRIVGPSIAGLLAALPGIGLATVFVAIALLYLTGFSMLLRFVRARRQSSPDAHVARPSSDQSSWAQMREGIAYIANSSLLRTLLLLGLVPIMFAMPIQSLLPAYAERVFEAGPVGLGVLAAALGAGAVVGSVAAASLAVSRQVLLQLVVGLVLGASLLGFALAGSIWQAVPLLVAVGAGQAGYNALNQSHVLAATEPRLHGRVMSVNMTTMFLAPVVTLPLAWLADLIGDRATLAGCGIVIMVTIVAVFALKPGVRRAL